MLPIPLDSNLSLSFWRSCHSMKTLSFSYCILLKLFITILIRHFLITCTFQYYHLFPVIQNKEMEDWSHHSPRFYTDAHLFDFKKILLELRNLFLPHFFYSNNKQPLWHYINSKKIFAFRPSEHIKTFALAFSKIVCTLKNTSKALKRPFHYFLRQWECNLKHLSLIWNDRIFFFPIAESTKMLIKYSKHVTCAMFWV